MPLFFANVIPWIGLVWSLSLALFYRKIFSVLFEEDHTKANDRTIPLWITLFFTVVYLLFPIRTLINKSYQQEDFTGIGARYYDQLMTKFASDYKRENPATRKQGLIEFLYELTKNFRDDDEEDESLQRQATSNSNQGVKKKKKRAMGAMGMAKFNEFANSKEAQSGTNEVAKKVV